MLETYPRPSQTTAYVDRSMIAPLPEPPPGKLDLGGSAWSLRTMRVPKDDLLQRAVFLCAVARRRPASSAVKVVLDEDGSPRRDAKS